jgi:PAS domain-containing protein
MLKGVKGKSISFYNNLLHQLPGLIVVTDKKNHFVYSNNYTAELFGYTNEDNMLGHDPHQIKCPAVECAENFIFQNLEVIRTGCDLTILDIHKYAYGDAKIL